MRADQLFPVAYHLLLERARMTAEEHEAQDKVDQYLRDVQAEEETGMPTLPGWARSADTFGIGER